MADDIVFELLHSEIINYALHDPKGSKDGTVIQVQLCLSLFYSCHVPNVAERRRILSKNQQCQHAKMLLPSLAAMIQGHHVSCVFGHLKQEADLSIVEYIGFAAGYKIMERLTREWPRFKDELDTMKFICTDFWTCIYRKQIDNLRTNHQGVYVLHDNAFRFLTNFSNGQQYLEYAPRFVAYTCGLIRGGLANLCISSIVTAEVQSMPSCKFHIQVQRT